MPRCSAEHSDRREDILDALSVGVHGYILKSQNRPPHRPTSLYLVRRDLRAANLSRTSNLRLATGTERFDQSAAPGSWGPRGGQVKQRNRPGACWPTAAPVEVRQPARKSPARPHDNPSALTNDGSDAFHF